MLLNSTLQNYAPFFFTEKVYANFHNMLLLLENIEYLNLEYDTLIFFRGHHNYNLDSWREA